MTYCKYVVLYTSDTYALRRVVCKIENSDRAVESCDAELLMSTLINRAIMR